MTRTPIRAVLRKGKSHYVCDERLKRRLQAVDLTRKSPRVREALLSLRDHLDLDMAEHLSGYDRTRVCVPKVCDCGRESCRYQCFMEVCASDWYQVQICNHNLLLADAIHRSLGRRPLLPEWSTLILDEAHKLPEAARQMFGTTLTAAELRTLIRALRGERYILAAETLEEAVGPALRELAHPWDGTRPFSHFVPFLARPHRTLTLIQKQIGTVLTHGTQRQLDQLQDKVSLFLQEQKDMIFYTAEDAHGGTMLCATVPDLTDQFRQTLWRQQKPMVLASGTLAVGEDFHRFKEATGLLTDGRVRESVSPSPFAYSKNCLLYVPSLPARQKAGQYYDKLTEEITALLDAAHGHALVLFTSYSAMAAVKERLRDQNLAYPLFTLGRNAIHTTKLFKNTPGGVLLATGAAWEGFDFPGDC
ncbi:MAG: ATP-dependent DNA helicase, partial [Oscillibacter sp.]|nr:ATP-dependent DNA helicase [Oscillibacter sp.]